MKPPPDVDPKQAKKKLLPKKRGATGEGQGWEKSQGAQKAEPMPERRKGRPKKTVEGTEPWMWRSEDQWTYPTSGRKRYRKIPTQKTTTKV